MNQPTDEAVVLNILDNAMLQCLTYLEALIPESGYLVGDKLSVADLAVTICFIQARYGDYEVDAAVAPKLCSYLDRAHASQLLTQRMAA